MAAQPLRDIPALQHVTVRDGVVLRPLAVSDAEQLLTILEEDPAIRKRVWVASVIHSVEDVAAQVADARQNDTLVCYVIVDNGAIAGMVTFWRAGDYFGDKADPDDYGFGYFLGVHARGRGLVTDSLVQLMAIAEKELEATSFIAFCEKDNAASGALLKKAGLEPTNETWTEPTQGWIEQKYYRRVSGT